MPCSPSSRAACRSQPCRRLLAAQRSNQGSAAARPARAIRAQSGRPHAHTCRPCGRHGPGSSRPRTASSALPPFRVPAGRTWRGENAITPPPSKVAPAVHRDHGLPLLNLLREGTGAQGGWLGRVKSNSASRLLPKKLDDCTRTCQRAHEQEDAYTELSTHQAGLSTRCCAGHSTSNFHVATNTHSVRHQGLLREQHRHWRQGLTSGWQLSPKRGDRG